jgi:NAD(P)-dependent dehydrogenase (short-subunit alcohol dehydrogenase family)
LLYHLPGSAIASNLARSLPATSKLTIAGRNKSSVDQLISQYPDTDFQPINAFLMNDVKRFCAEYASSVRSSSSDLKEIDILVLTQGILTLQGRTPTSPENIDQKMALHYYSRMLIVRELEPILSPKALVLSVLDGRGSKIHDNAMKWTDLDLAQPGNYGVPAAARHCQAMNDGMLQAFAERHGSEGRTFVHAYPGIVSTPLLTKNMPFYAKLPLRLVSAVMSVSPEKCAEHLLQGSADVHAKGRGSFNIDDQGKEVQKTPATKEQMDKLWEHTWGLIDRQ